MCHYVAFMELFVLCVKPSKCPNAAHGGQQWDIGCFALGHRIVYCPEIKSKIHKVNINLIFHMLTTTLCQTVLL
jgi:hypothetical protein